MWEIDTSLIDGWLDGLDERSAYEVAAALTVLGDVGPTLGRPLVDRITASRHHQMKELRPGSAGRTELRILFAFDPVRQAIMLLAGDKSGDWERWYQRAIPLADQLFDDHLAQLRQGQSAAKSTSKKRSKR
ncbi:MAG: type II toxin-antitoxin system RelE/ParE family toxin [Bifidobacteriaceae bacterium]|nr:type II toxin-antitoxin system RelE/ParE family toxin [Bifidobacteriaceae bacterium]